MSLRHQNRGNLCSPAVMENEQPPRDVLLQQVLNERLKNPKYDTYDVVNVLRIYWKDADGVHREESETLRDFLKDQFGYSDCEEFAIPSEDSHLELDVFVNQSIVKINRQLRQHRSGLLLVHYGGHGDDDANDTRRQQRRSVWTP